MHMLVKHLQILLRFELCQDQDANVDQQPRGVRILLGGGLFDSRQGIGHEAGRDRPLPVVGVNSRVDSPRESVDNTKGQHNRPQFAVAQHGNRLFDVGNAAIGTVVRELAVANTRTVRAGSFSTQLRTSSTE